MGTHLFHIQRRLDDGHMLLNVPFQGGNVNWLAHGTSHGCRIESDDPRLDTGGSCHRIYSIWRDEIT